MNIGIKMVGLGILGAGAVTAVAALLVHHDHDATSTPATGSAPSTPPTTVPIPPDTRPALEHLVGRTPAQALEGYLAFHDTDHDGAIRYIGGAERSAVLWWSADDGGRFSVYEAADEAGNDDGTTDLQELRAYAPRLVPGPAPMTASTARRFFDRITSS